MKKYSTPKVVYKKKDVSTNGNNNNKQNQQTFTHFVSIPFIQSEQKQTIDQYQKQILSKFSEEDQKCLRKSSSDLMHITVVMLALPTEEKKAKAQQVLQESQQFIFDQIKQQKDNKLEIDIEGLDCFRKKPHFKNKNQLGEVTILYSKIQENEILNKISDKIIRGLIQNELLNPEDENFKKTNAIYDHNKGIFRPQCYHMTLFRVNSGKDSKIDFEPMLEEFGKLNIGKYTCQTIDISTRFHFDENKFYLPLKQLDLNEINQSISNNNLQIQESQDNQQNEEEQKEEEK